MRAWSWLKAHPNIFWITAILWSGLCLYLSWQPGKETASLSSHSSRWILDILKWAGIHMDWQSFHMAYRKAAHFGIFFIQQFLYFAALAQKRNMRTSSWIAFVFAALLAFLAEAGKLLVEGRHFQLDEYGLDVIGAGAGMLLERIGQWIQKRKTTSREQETSTGRTGKN